MSDLKERLDRELARVLPSGDARAAVDTRVARRRRRRGVLLPAVTLVLTAGLVAGLTIAFSSDPRPPAEDQAIAMPGEPVEVMVDGRLLWVLTSEQGCEGPVCNGYVVKVDTARGQVIDRIPVTSPNGIAAGAGSIWVVSFADDTLLRFDPDTGSLQATIPLSLPFTVGDDGDRSFLPVDVDANDEAVWVSSGRGALAQVDPATDDIVDIVPRRSHSGGPLAIGQEGVWVADSLNGAVLVDPATHEVVDAVRLEDETGRRFSVNSLVARDGSVWAVGNWADPIEELDGAGYVAGEGHAVVEIEEREDRLVDSILSIREGAAWLLADDDLWVVEQDGAYLRRIDPVQRTLSRSIDVPFGRPLAVSGVDVWSAVGESLRRWELPRESPESSPSATESQCKGAIDLMPTYLPWIQGDIPAPHETYDASIDRDQLSWAGPHGTGVGLTLYPNTPLGNSGEETDVIIDGEVGHLHRFDESDLVGMWWDLSGRHCNFLELSLSPGDWTKDQAIDELMRIARSLRPAA
jgi:streptogramin lyase